MLPLGLLSQKTVYLGFEPPRKQKIITNIEPPRKRKILVSQKRKKLPSIGLVKSYNLSYNSDLSYNFFSCKSFFHIVSRVSFNVCKAGAAVWFVAKEFVMQKLKHKVKILEVSVIFVEDFKGS